MGGPLVAPADVEAPDTLSAIRSQAPLPSGRLPMRTHRVLSGDDPFLSLERGLRLAETWGGTVADVIPDGGHLATRDGHGPWAHVAALIERHAGTTPRTAEDHAPSAR